LEGQHGDISIGVGTFLSVNDTAHYLGDALEGFGSSVRTAFQNIVFPSLPDGSYNGVPLPSPKPLEAHVCQGASLPDPSRLFNSSLAGNTRRAIDIHEGEQVDAAAFKALVKSAVAANRPSAKKSKLGARMAQSQKRMG
jgi:hypothetical protein